MKSNDKHECNTDKTGNMFIGIADLVILWLAIQKIRRRHYKIVIKHNFIVIYLCIRNKFIRYSFSIIID